ncbi:MAG: hypothetical protein J6W33_01640 [Spirochaetia bacterium]|nr:hypothetical protein [Spirochaetia bacterium]
MSTRYELYQQKVDTEILEEREPTIELLTGKLHLTKSNSTAVYYGVTQYIEEAGGYVNQVWSVKSTTPANLDNVVIINGKISVAQISSSSVTVTGDGIGDYETKVVSSTHRTTNITVLDPTQDITVLC